MKKDVLLSGYYGFKNYGDDIFCQVAAWGASKFWQRQAKFMTPDLPIFPNDLIIHKPTFFRTKLTSRFYEYLESISTDLKVYSGGSIFSRKPDRFYSIQRFDKVLAAFGKELGAIGISVGPFSSKGDYVWIRKYLSKFSFLSTRDTQSYEILREMNISGKIVKAFDLAVLYPLLFENSIKKPKNGKLKVIGISVCHYERYVGKDLKVEMEREVQILKALELLLFQREDFILKFFNLNASSLYGDREITFSFIDKLEKYSNRIELKVYDRDTKDIFDEIRSCDLFLGTRLHSGIMAYTAGVPFILIEYHPKCTAFLDDINYPVSFRYGNPKIDPYLLSNSIAQMLDKDDEVFYQNLFPLKNAQEQAMKNFIDAPWSKI